MTNTDEKTPENRLTADDSASSEVVRIDFGNLKKDLGGFVRGTVEEAINGLLEAEAEQICNAKRYERSDERSAHRSGHYERRASETEDAQASRSELRDSDHRAL